MKKDLGDRIRDIGEYFRGIEKYNDCIIVKVAFPDKWNVTGSMDGVIKVAPSESTANEYFYYADGNERTYDDIFDLIEGTIEGNQETFLKLTLLKEKIEELRSLFSDENVTVNMLKNLRFVMDEPKKKRGRKSNKVKKTEEDGHSMENNAETVMIDDGE